MTSERTERKILHPKRSARYLKLIAIFKIANGVLLLLLGGSILMLGTRAGFLDAVSDWVSDEILLEHSHAISYLLNKLQDVLDGGALRASGFFALFYAALLLVEGIGVYRQKRWAEYLMVFATGILIPLEVHHVIFHPSPLGFLILVVNCFIVWFLFTVLRRESRPRAVERPREIAVNLP